MPRQKGQAVVEARAATLERLDVEYVDVNALKPNSYNPNRQDPRDFELLLRSMREDGFTQPVVAQKGTNEIVDGEHRWRAAQEIGMTQIPVVFVDMDEAQMRLSTLRHNRARGTEDMDLTASLFRDMRELGALDAATDALGLDAKELDRILDDAPAPEALAGSEFGQAWEPTGHAYATEEKVERESNHGPVLESSTPEVIAILSKAAEAAINAPTEEERVELLRARNRAIYRISVTYSAEEAVVVRAVLGDSPAAKLVALCRARVPAG